ncbi:MAG: ABC transporter substrate-binding protein, partial [Eubacterium sp.]
YSGKIAIPDITGSSTGWLLVQTIIDAYGEDEGAAIMSGLIKNAGPHMESSGSGPFKKVKAGEVAFAFGLRHQAVAAKLEGLPIDFISPKEGSYYLTESLAVVDKGKDTNTAETMAIAECIVKMGRPELIKTYPVPLYKGEINNQTAETVHSKTFSQPLTVDLLQTHQDFSERCKLKK